MRDVTKLEPWRGRKSFVGPIHHENTFRLYLDIKCLTILLNFFCKKANQPSLYFHLMPRNVKLSTMASRFLLVPEQQGYKKKIGDKYSGLLH